MLEAPENSTICGLLIFSGFCGARAEPGMLKVVILSGDVAEWERTNVRRRRAGACHAEYILGAPASTVNLALENVFPPGLRTSSITLNSAV